MRELLVALVLLAWVPARAEDKVAAREAYDLGSKYYYLNEFDKALEQYKRAYLNFEDPAFLFNIAQCYRQLGRKDEAVKMYRSYLRRQPTAKNKVEVERLIAILDKEIAQDRSTRATPPQGPIEPPHDASAAPPSPGAVTPAPTPAPTATPPPVAAAPTVAVTAAPSDERPAKTPVYKKWWLWTAVGVVAVAAVGLGVGLSLSQSSYPSTSPSNGTFRF